MTELCRAKVELLRARNALEKAIFAEMDKYARKHGIDCMTLIPDPMCQKNGEDIETPYRINKLNDMLIDFVHPGGFQSLWSPEKGWH
jgi:hypothetical protein